MTTSIALSKATGVVPSFAFAKESSSSQQWFRILWAVTLIVLRILTFVAVAFWPWETAE